ncbi:YidC/Oxa1 family membrane protein insertase [Arthrobacter sp. 49Tsu3.1M3]|uniref:membrane protein insertase YidC n=1 Tax=Arthrobacter sp. 49Tsu3.1M3 TaxID=1279029 RepID=UPI0009A883B6|nr:membrane protein insertase YidC [Arthrobacter sp. 49Tsu3.1M3]SKB44289.1 YidC/Oxa1 family membrane protein insertase [Arthrobacter sp. 49Tsu3.1M3]
MDLLGTILAPFKWLVSAMLAGFHDGFSAVGMPPASGWTWTLAIIGLVLVIRAALIPVFLKQVNVQQRMRRLQPDLKKLQEKYEGKTDPLSRQAMAQEQMALYKAHGTNPFSACLPLLIQMPFFFALFQMLSGISAAAGQGEAVGAMSPEQVAQFDESTIFGAPLSASLLHGGGGSQLSVWILSIAMILAMTASQLITQRQIMARSLSGEAVATPLMGPQKVLLYSLPVVFGVGGIVFPIGVLIYWTTTNLWTMGQQFAVRWDRMGP